MGTTYSVKIVVEPNEVIQTDSLKIAIDQLLTDINKEMSTYIPESEISRFNNFEDTVAFGISNRFYSVLEKSIQLCAKTNGALEITVGPLVNLWGFGPEKRNTTLPTEEEIEERRAYVGYEKLILNSLPPTVRKKHPNIRCSLSATAKGFGVDELGSLIKNRGHSNYYVEIGGEVIVSGINQNGINWRLGISSPGENGAVQKIVELDNQAMATSGDYFNYKEVDGVRYSHTIDPTTARPITHKLASVSVIDDNCLDADGLATAINVMGPEKGFDFAVNNNIAAFFIIRENDLFIEKMSPKFSEIFEKNKD